MNHLIENFHIHLQRLVAYLPTLLYALVSLLIFIGLGYAVAIMVKRGLRRGQFSQTYESFFLKIVHGIFVILGLLLALKILGFTGVATSILAGGGVTAIVLGFAFRDIGENILAGFFLAFSRPFKVGDLIQSEGLEGRVKSVELRHTHIRTGNGCDIFIPSSQIFSKPLFNYTRDGLRRADFTIGIDYADDTLKAASLLLETVKAVPRILQEPAPAVKITAFSANYVEVNVSFWIDTFKQEQILSELQTKAMNGCRERLIEEGFTLSSNVATALQMEKITVQIENK